MVGMKLAHTPLAKSKSQGRRRRSPVAVGGGVNVVSPSGDDYEPVLADDLALLAMTPEQLAAQSTISHEEFLREFADLFGKRQADGSK